jgi:hypothetical protein
MAVCARLGVEAAMRHVALASACCWAAAALLGACAGGAPPPDWQANARQAADSAVAAYLTGDSRAAAQDFERLRSEVSRTGRPDLLARAELIRCAAQVASLEFGPCAGFEAMRGDAAAAELVYADHLAARPLSRDGIARLPQAQQGAAALVAGGDPAQAGLLAIDDPLSRLIAVAVLFQSGKAGPAAISLALDTASAQGWRRPLLAWLGVSALRAERAGDEQEAKRLRRRIELVQGAAAQPAAPTGPTPMAPGGSAP